MSERRHVRTDSYPTHQHACQAQEGRLVSLRFRGRTPMTGLTVVCEACNTVFEFVKPCSQGVIHGQAQGGRTHFVMAVVVAGTQVMAGIVFLAALAFADEPPLRAFGDTYVTTSTTTTTTLAERVDPKSVGQLFLVRQGDQCIEVVAGSGDVTIDGGTPIIARVTKCPAWWGPPP